jgi:hypothetical protein
VITAAAEASVVKKHVQKLSILLGSFECTLPLQQLLLLSAKYIHTGTAGLLARAYSGSLTRSAVSGETAASAASEPLAQKLLCIACSTVPCSTNPVKLDEVQEAWECWAACHPASGGARASESPHAASVTFLVACCNVSVSLCVFFILHVVLSLM